MPSALDFTAPLQYLRMKDAAESIYTDRLAHLWMESACKSKICQPKLSDYNSSAWDKHVVPFMEAASESMGTPELSSHYVILLDNFLDMAKEECGVTDSTNFCQDPSQFKSLSTCLQSKGWLFILRNIPTFLPILMANSCSKQADYLTSPDLFDKAIPAFLQDYIESC
ncbi:unnamed protein product [Penicillium palitans]